MIYKNIKFCNYFFFTIILTGIFFSFERGSNFSDGDSFDLIISFLDFIDFGIYNPSRGAYGHLIPEFIIGFFAYNFGTPVSNSICFIFYCLSILVLSKVFNIESSREKLIFYLLIFSNFLLLVENTNSIDYPIAFFFFSLGLFQLKKNKIFYSSLFFSFAIISRANFVIFIYPIILIYLLDKKINKENLISFFKISIFTTIFTIFFFIPTLITYNFELTFIKIPFLFNSSEPGWYGGPEFAVDKLSPRFIFKVYNILGIFSSFIFIYLFIFKFKILKHLKKFEDKICIYIIFSNLIMFYFMPTKTLLLNPFIVFSYILLSKYFNYKIIYAIIFFNFFQWFFSYQILNIEYKNQELCFAKEAISAKFEFKLQEGELISFLKYNKNYSECYAIHMREYSNEFIENLPLKLSKGAIR